LGTIGLACAAICCPDQVLAQETEEQTRSITAEEAIANAEEIWSGVTDIKKASPCDDESNDPDVIIVCRRWEEGERYMFERPTRADTEVSGSGAPRAPDFSVSCLRDGGAGVCMRVGSVPPPAFMVDFDALPETPAGSEAARLYGGPTTDDLPAQEEPEEEVDIAAETQRGVEDDIYGP
jgi:hypothetical protein